MKSKIIVNFIFFVTVLMMCLGCTQNPEWTYVRTINFEKVTPLGIVKDGDFLWISDSDHNKIVKTDLNGNIVETYKDFERPMHLVMDNDRLFIPEYSADTITIMTGNKRSYLPLKNELDAPAGIDIKGDAYAIADFYNHRIVYHNNGEDLTFGKKGRVNGTFHYPTDIQFENNMIYIADAYNNRIQVFDEKGKFKQSIGSEDGMNAATGIYVSDQFIFVTDFENSRVLVYDLAGQLLQILNEPFNKPTDAILDNDKLYVTNYKGKSISIFEYKK